MIDEASRFHVAKIITRGHTNNFTDLGNCTSIQLLQAMNKWTRYLPVPQTIHVDDEGVFASDEFKQYCTDRSITIKSCAGEAHWQNGIIERHIGTLKGFIRRLFLDDLYTEQDLEYILDRSTEAKNNNGAYG